MRSIPARDKLSDFDSRLADDLPKSSSPTRVAALANLRAKMPGVQVDFDPITGGPASIMAVGKFLSQPGGQSVDEFVNANRGLFGHSSDALTTGKSRITRDDTSAHNGMKTLVWQQEIDGIPFFQTILKANLTRDGTLITAGGNFLADPPTAAEGNAVKRAALIANPPVSATRAVRLAAENIGTTLDESGITTAGGAQGIERRQKFQASTISDTSAGLAWMPMDATSAELAWDVTIMSTERGEMFRVLVDAETGGVLVRQSLTNYITPATFRVYARATSKQPFDSPTPFSPGHPTPLAVQPAGVASELVTLDALNTTASPNGWIDDGVTETLGNNVAAHTDSDGFPNVPDLPRPTSATRVFDFPVAFASQPVAYKDAAVTNLFYLNNWLHDKLYELGFTESAGNFQNNNFGRGGIGSDAVQADAQDGGGTNNANFSTPPDGSPGRMQMYVFTGPDPDIDGDFDSEIVIHEYVHGLSNRLVGGGAGISASQTQGMGEGWSDFYALSLLSEPGDDPNGCYPAGSYATRSLSNLTTNYYYGIRRYPYSTDPSKNPLTFRDIDPAQASVHAGIPRSPIISNTANEVHNQGEVWGSALWELRANLIAKLGFATGNPLALQLVTDGMKLCPLNPNFLQARDAILQADLVNNAGTNQNELWAAFAKRGMGAGAISPASTTTSGLTEAFDVPDDLSVTPLGAFAASGQRGGSVSPANQVFTLHNNGASSLVWTAGKSQPWLTLSATTGTLPAGASTTVTISFNAAASSLPAGSYSDTVTFSNTGSAAALLRSVNLTIEPQYLTIFRETFESGVLAGAWAITGTGNHRTIITTSNSPQAGARHLIMDSSMDGSYSRNEATLTLDLAGRSNVTLNFWAKMFNDEPHAPATDPFTGGSDFDGVAVSANGGTTWHEIKDLRTITNQWQKITLNLDSAIAARGIAYTSDFKIRFNHFDNYSISTDGIALDDILVAETFTNSLAITAPSAVVEGDSAVTATVSSSPVPTTDLEVFLESNSPDATVPNSVILPAGAPSVDFPITPVDDGALDGSQPATITASAPMFATGSAVLMVHDNENAVITLDLPDNATEGSSPLTGLIHLDAPVDRDVAINLSSDNPAIVVPGAVTIPAGGISATFTLLPVNDNRINGERLAGISASVTGWTSAIRSITIFDDETTLLALTLPVMREGDFGKSGTVALSGILDADLTVTLACDDPTELTVPTTVTITAGQTQALFPLTIVDDGDTDGTQPIMLTASAPGFSAASLSRGVADNEVHHFDLSPMPPEVLRNSAVAVNVTARDVNDALISNYAESITFTATDNAVADVSLTTSPPSAFVDGVLATQVTFTRFATGVTLTARNTAGKTGASTLFDVATGPLERFAWDTVASPRFVDAPFQATLRAVDSADNPVTSFIGQATLSAIVLQEVDVLTWTGYTDTGASGEYVRTKQAISSHFTNYRETATTTTDPSALAAELLDKDVFLIVEQEFANASTLGSLGTAWASTLNNFVNNGGTVIACSNTTSEHLILSNSSLLNVTPLRSLATAQLTKPAETPLNAGINGTFTGSFLHTYSTTNGTVDLKTTTNEAVVISRNIGAGRVIMIGTDFFNLGTGMDQVIANAVSLAQTSAFDVLPVSPPVTLPFADGCWTGSVSVPFTTPDVILRATLGAETCDSNRFAVESVPLPSNRDTLFTETFESGSLNPAWWTSTGTGNFRTQVTSLQSPHGGIQHLTMDSSANAARNEATLTLDLSGRTGVTLGFWAVGYADEPDGPPPSPFSGGADFDGVAISADGTTWWEVQGLRSLAGTYGEFTIDLDAAIAAHGIAYNSNFKIRFNQYDDFPITTDGIGIDDIIVSAAVPPSELTLTLPTQVTEGAGDVGGTISIMAPRTTDLVIALSSQAPDKITVPPTVTITAGQSSANFDLTVFEDLFIDGEKLVGITAATAGDAGTSARVRVEDNDGGTISLTLPATASENSVSGTGTLTLSTPALVPLTFLLTSNAPLVALPQTEITLPRGATTALFQVTIPDDGIVDGDQTARLSASLATWTAGTSDLLVTDDESRNLTLTLPARLRETDAPKPGVVSLGGVAAADVTILLNCDNISEITIPDTVIIPAGENSVAFNLTIQDDFVADGPQPFNIAATSPTFIDAVAGGIVRDNEAHHFTFMPIGVSQLSNGPVPAIITARDSADAIIRDYDSAVTLSALGNSGVLDISPSTAGTFINGVWSGSVLIDALDTNVVIIAEDGHGHAGSSNPFDLVAGQIDHFVWEDVPSPQTIDTPFMTTVRAVNSDGMNVTGYNGIADLTVSASGPNSPTGSGGSLLGYPIATDAHDSRTTVLYKANEVGGPSRLTALALDLSIVPIPGETLGNWTIRVKHTPQAFLTNGSAWDNSGWTTVYQANPMITATGWMTFTFTTPFDFNGADNLLVDFTMDRATSTGSSVYVRGTGGGGTTVKFATSNSSNGIPLAWSGTTPFPASYTERPNVIFSNVKEIPIRPVRSGSFANGVWTGEVSIPVSGSGLALVARAGAVSGSSGAFEVLAASPPPSGLSILFEETFESGTLNPARWTSTGTGNFRTQVTSLFTPYAGNYHLTMDSTGGFARNEATLTLDLAGRSGVVLSFRAAGFNDEANGPPPSPFTGGSNFDGVAISADGNTWWEVQGLRSLPAGYNAFTVDLDAAVAGLGIAFNSSFKVRFNQFDDFPLPSDGIAIDNIQITAIPTTGFTFNVPSQVSESDGTLTASVILDQAPASDTVVFLTSSIPAKISAPPSVTVPAGETMADFVLTIPDDVIADGNRQAILTGTIFGKEPGTTSVTVIDDDILPFTLTAPATTSEGSTGHTATIHFAAAPSGPVTVSLSSDDTSELVVQGSIILQPGQTSATFPITVVDDSQIDDTQTVTLSASVSVWGDAVAVIQITDNENRLLTLAGPYPAYEGGSIGGTVFLSGTLSEDLAVSLVSSDSSQFAVPAGLVIPAGSTNVFFIANPVDDSATDGVREVTITASANGFQSATSQTAAYDDDVHHFSISPIPTAVIRGAPVPVTLTARDVDDSLISVFTSACDLSAEAVGLPVSMTPGTTGNFAGGTWTGNVVFNTLGTGVVLTAADSTGHAGFSNSFTVGAGEATTLSWDPLPAIIETNNPVAATVRASDAYGNLVTSLNGSAVVSLGAPQRTTGTGNNNTVQPLYTSAHESRTQTIYQASELGPAGKLTGLALDVSQLPGVPLTRFTIRIRPTALTSYTAPAVWADSGWTTVYQSNLDVSHTGWVFLPFQTPYEYNGAGNLMVDFSFDNSTSGTNGLVRGKITATPRSYYFYSYGTHGDPLEWSGSQPLGYTSNIVPNLRLRVERTLPVIPTAIILTNGMWTGSISTTTAGAGLTLTADGPRGLTGESDAFTSIPGAIMTVDPAMPLTTTGPYGGPFDPAGKSYTLTNSGDAPLAWTADKSASWLSLSETAGTLAPGASTTILVSLVAGTLEPAIYSDTITFTNTSSGRGNTTRGVTLDIQLPTPIPLPEPIFTAGSVNTIEWNPVPGADSYDVQFSADVDFTAPLSSGWIGGTSHTFTGLADGAVGFYRVRCRVSPVSTESGWSITVSSTQDASPPVLARNTPTLTDNPILIARGGASDATSGILAVSVNGRPVVSEAGLASWNSLPILLAPGDNLISVTASDQVIPPNVAMEVWNITYTGPATTDADGDGLPDDWENDYGLNPADDGRIDPLQGSGGDPDTDGISNLMEYALGLDPSTADTSGLPVASLKVKAADNLTYLTFEYRRRIVRDGLRYIVETRPDLETSAWDDSVDGFEEISAVPVGDGVTEQFTVRILPSVGNRPCKFVRLRVVAE